MGGGDGEQQQWLAEDDAVARAPAVETPVVETPVVETPVVETPVVGASSVGTLSVEARADGTPIVRAPAVGAPAVGAPAFEEMPRLRVTRRQAIAFGVFILSVVAFLYFVLPQISGVGDTLKRIGRGDVWWIALGVALELASFAGYVVLFRAVFTRERGLIGWRESYLITMAGLAATRLFAAAGAGGVALTAWALRRAGMRPRLVATRMVAFMALLYAIYLGVLILDGFGLGTGLLPGGGSFALTVLPALLGVLLLALASAVVLLPGDLERHFAGRGSGSERRSRWLARALSAPAALTNGIRGGVALLRTRDLGLLGAPAWWGFDVCVLWVSFKAFGHAPDFTVILMCYFLGTLGNLLPLPGGLGGVEGGMIGAFAAFGVEFNLAVLAVLTYRGISFWLPTVPGAIAYFQLRRTVARWRDAGVGSDTIKSKVMQ